MAVGGVSAERTSANAVTLFPKAGFNVNELEAIVIEHLDLDGPLPIAITIVNQPRCGVLCSFAAADEARRAHSSLQQLGSSLDSGAFASQLYIKKDPEMASGVGGGRSPGRRPALDLRREVEAGLRRVTPHACKCHVPARRQNGKEQPRSGLDEMYIMQQAGHACGVTKVAELRFPQLLCDSLAGARILRGVAALLHMEFCKPTERYVVERLKQCYQGIFSRSLRRALVDDCCAHAARRHADVSKRNIEAYLGEVVHRLVVRR
ncbi:hypothetical protein COHA_004365 [Chlorella ohadii]|uniref:Uncharacterized protein n=1 Tax=Chlorella ohadii TaxID=2649997 RepID=A0AAD5H2U8_9CHLO|nr:hypothetical protein COHA_004365 [Chlorella ohadii]